MPGSDSPASASTPLPRPRRVPPCRLADLVAVIGLDGRRPLVTGAPAAAGATPGGGEDLLVSGVTHASDAVRPGDLYAALPGSRRHGAEFVGAAAAAGARAVLTDPAGAGAAGAAGLPVLVVPDPRAVLGTVAARVYGDPSARVPVVGITGTAGKTTTAYLVDAGLRAAGQSPALLGTVETRLGDLVIDSVRTTPEATDLHALLAVALEHGVDAVVMEVSSHALALGRVGGVRFAVGAWTNFGLDHLDFHDDQRDYFAAKARLFDGRCRVELVNADDPALAGVVGPGTVTFSAAGDHAATWYATGLSGSGYDQRFVAHGPGGAWPVGVRMPGLHNVANALLAVAALVEVGVPPEVAAAGVAGCAGVPGRLERVAGPGPVLGVVDYAHKPDAIVAALAALRAVADARGGRLSCVIGAGGDRDAGKRALMGAAAAGGADLVVVTDDNPRTEDPTTIRAAVAAGTRGAAGARVLEVAGRRRAIDEAVRRAERGDVVAVLGKGHERGQEVAGEVLPFDDRTELADALNRWEQPR